MSVHTLLEHLEGVRETGTDRWIARCPAHDDSSPSLSVRNAGDRLLVNCFAGCDALDVVHAVGLSLSDLFADRPAYTHGPRRSRIPAGDRLQLLSHEALVVALLAADFLKSRAFSEADWERLAKAIARIGEVRHHG